MAKASPNPIDEKAYRRWLMSNTGLTDRSLNDVVSRTRRITAMADLGGAKTADHVLIALLGNPAFKACSLSVQSQLKRAGTLYVRFRQDGNA